jgi:protein-tyrosine-phosphatase
LTVASRTARAIAQLIPDGVPQLWHGYGARTSTCRSVSTSAWLPRPTPMKSTKLAGRRCSAVVEVMREVGIDLAGRKPKRLSVEMQLHADWAVTIGCGDVCPYVPTRVDDWDIPDPAGKPIEEVREIRDLIEERSVTWSTAAIVANLVFSRSAISISTHHRATPAHCFAEIIATLGLPLVIFSLTRTRRAATTTAAVGAYIGAAYWFTSSTSFAYPAITVGRIFSNFDRGELGPRWMSIDRGPCCATGGWRRPRSRSRVRAPRARRGQRAS